MKTTAISFLLMALPAFLFADDNKDPELVKVYCFSEDTEAGFEDVPAMSFCQYLNKHGTKKKSLVRVESRDEAHVIAEFLSAEEVTTRGETTYVNSGMAWTPDGTTNIERARVIVGEFSKEFSGEGTNGASATGNLMRRVEKWIRNNRENILEKAQTQAKAQ